MPETIGALCAEIVARPAPVIFLDTCSILDVARAFSLTGSGSADAIVSAAVRLARSARAESRGAWIVVPEVVASEWQDNLDAVHREQTAWLQRLRREMATVRRVEDAADPIPHPARPEIELELADRLRSIAESVIGSAAIIAPDDGCKLEATRRLIEARRPASRAGRQYKDCEIFEHCLGLARLLREQGSTDRMCFVTSNTADYGRPGEHGTTVEDELATHGVRFVTDLAWGCHEIGI